MTGTGLKISPSGKERTPSKRPSLMLSAPDIYGDRGKEARIMKEVAIKISRFNPETDDRPVLREYDVPYQDEDSVLGALLYIYEEIDSTLLFNYGCRYRLCGKCAIKISGKPKLACETPLEGGMILEPLDHLSDPQGFSRRSVRPSGGVEAQ